MHRPLTLTALILAAITICSCAEANELHEARFSWHEANARAASAQRPDDFRQVAERYRALVAAGVRNQSVFYNLGTALLRAELYEDSLLALLRAERYGGSTGDIRRNMLLAVAGIEDDPEPSLPWYRQLVFWHYELSFPIRVTIAVAAFSILWMALLLRILSYDRFSGKLSFLSALLLVTLGTSVVVSITGEVEDRQREQLPLAMPQQTLIAGDAEGGADATTK